MIKKNRERKSSQSKESPVGVAPNSGTNLQMNLQFVAAIPDSPVKMITLPSPGIDPHAHGTNSNVRPLVAISSATQAPTTSISDGVINSMVGWPPSTSNL